ncbi:hypothetical protein [Formosa haliotis]|uniref:hypothetical protein n=1 Tax=Formosa haliotis TaxID=1555194 RepID=UPI00082581C0|nr:hypothetical protein [Formosa haliotis]
MKFITILASIILFSTCGLHKTNTTVAENSTTTKAIEKTQSDVFIEYSAITRGKFLLIKLEDQQISVQRDQHKEPKTRSVSGIEWDLLMDRLHATDLNTFSDLEAPSSKRMHDGAAAARLKVIEDDNIYATPEFDHGHPNTKIKALVDYILSLAEKVE